MNINSISDELLETGNFTIQEAWDIAREIYRATEISSADTLYELKNILIDDVRMKVPNDAIRILNKSLEKVERK